jgi:hypothetical protein
MNKADIIRMAREADAAHDLVTVTPFLERFAHLVADALRDEMWERAMKLVAEAVAVEREECAKLAKEHAADCKVGGSLYPMLGVHNSKHAATACDHIAHLISEREILK